MSSSKKIDALQERRLTPAEVRAYLDAPTSDAERESVLELARWFRRRYPTPLERLAYATRIRPLAAHVRVGHTTEVRRDTCRQLTISYSPRVHSLEVPADRAGSR